jgi:hypothetical protein
MIWNEKMDEASEGTRHEADDTLRLVAMLPPPENLTDRVHARLASAAATPPRRGFWSYWLPAQRVQFAAAAALVLAVVGSTWSAYHQHPQLGTTAPAVRPAPPAPAAGGFGTASTVRVPPTLNPIKVPPAPRRKPGAGHAAVKPLAKPAPAAVPAANP